jgi:hypothetical protein
MKHKFWVALMLLILLSLLMVPVHAAQIDPNSIVAVWLCDEGQDDTLADASGNKHDGTFVGNVEWAEGKFERALEFFGEAGSRVEIPHHDSLTLDEWTITAWVNLPTGGGGAWVIIVVKDPGNGPQNYALDLNEQGRVFSEVTSGGGWSDCGSNTTVYDDQWHFLAASYDGSALGIYVDGETENEQNFATPDSNTAPVTIGDRMDNSQPITGVIDDVGLFSMALDEDDLQDIMDNGLGKALGIAAVEPSAKLTTIWGYLKQR